MRQHRRHASRRETDGAGIPVSRHAAGPGRAYAGPTRDPGSIRQKAEATASRFDGADGPDLPLQPPRAILPELLSAFDDLAKIG